MSRRIFPIQIEEIDFWKGHILVFKNVNNMLFLCLVSGGILLFEHVFIPKLAPLSL